jgi:hypothetical protein
VLKGLDAALLQLFMIVGLFISTCRMIVTCTTLKSMNAIDPSPVPACCHVPALYLQGECLLGYVTKESKTVLNPSDKGEHNLSRHVIRMVITIAWS